MAGIRHDQEVLDRTGFEKLPHDALRLNVLMFGFDSLSRNMFKRHLPHTYHYLRETQQMIDLRGYNIVGDGTPQALIPILTGVPQNMERQIQCVWVVWLLVLLA